MLSQTVEYALRASVYLASLDGKPTTTEEVAAKTRVPAAYLAKILQGLSKAGLVRSQRGVGGGVCLARPPGQLTLLDVINAIEPLKRIQDCPLGRVHPTGGLCALHRRLDQAIAEVEAIFHQTTLSSMLAEVGGPLCAAQVAVPSVLTTRVESA